MRLRTLFTPLKTFMPINFSLNRPSDISEDANGIVTADRKITSAFPYSVSYIQPMYGEQMLKRALAFSRKNLYRDAMSDLIQKRGKLTNELRKEMGPLLPSVFSENKKPMENTRTAKSELYDLNNGIENLIKLYKRAIQIESDYTKLSRAVPERVKELASSITKDHKSDYEKVAAIENYLRNNYKYTYNPGEVPPGKDFADYFLFEGKNGYCTHFATAMALLLRSIDIPARYVEGYVLPEKPSEENIYNVTNNNAHAWVEVYFEGFGWLTFEPTPAYAGTMNYRAIAGTESEADDPFSEIDDLAEKYGKDYKDPGTGASAMAPAAQNNKEMPVYIALFFAALLALSFSVNKASYLLDVLKIRASNNNDKIVIIYENLLKWFSSLGYTVRPGETAREFGRRIDQSYYFEEISFEEMSKIFEKARYGRHQASVEEVRIFVGFSRKFKKTALKEMGFKRYMPLRYMVLKI
jgi:transglutaminase-like putative cysteine protease